MSKPPLVYSIACPRCGAFAGDPCRSVRKGVGRYLKRPHRQRVQAYAAAKEVELARKGEPEPKPDPEPEYETVPALRIDPHDFIIIVGANKVVAFGDNRGPANERQHVMARALAAVANCEPLAQLIAAVADQCQPGETLADVILRELRNESPETNAPGGDA
jgi:hypothetical protein